MVVRGWGAVLNERGTPSSGASVPRGEVRDLLHPRSQVLVQAIHPAPETLLGHKPRTGNPEPPNPQIPQEIKFHNENYYARMMALVNVQEY